MPIWADPKRGETVRLLADDDMTLLATFVAPPSVRPTAADLRLVEGTDPERFARVAARDLPGVRVVTGLDEATALTAAGADVVSTEVHLVRGELQEREPPLHWAAPRLGPGLRVTGLADVGADELAAAHLAAHPPIHPDHAAVVDMHADGSFAALLAGELMGPVHDDASALVLDERGRVVAAAVVTVWPTIGDEWSGGPWVSVLFRLRTGGASLLGRALLARAVVVAHLEGHEAIGVSASAANRATTTLLPRLGFGPRFHRVALDLPGRWPGQGRQ